MNENSLHYFDSHGCKVAFLSRKDNVLTILKRRKFVYVLPEVVELIDRIESRCGSEVALENVSCELCVHPVVIRSIFVYLKSIGLLGKEESLSEGYDCIFPDLRKDWSGNIYPILRPVREEDYGKNVKCKKENIISKIQEN